jgi:DNA-binding response OmpR family regulator
MTKRILIADDEQAVRQLLEVVLSSQGYEVLSAQNGDQAVRMAQERVPDLVLVDLMMPHLDGYEAIRQLRNDTRTAHLPMLILTAKSTPDDVVTGFETGADEYITKPFHIPELLARIRGHLRRAAQRPVRNPLTDLPGNVLLTEELKYRLRQPEPFAYLYVDLDNFKAFNDTYGPARGDRVIRLLADVLSEQIAANGAGGDFIGHIGGDDFVVITSPDVLDTLCRTIIDTFDQRVRTLYDPGDLERGYLQGIDRQGVPRSFPIISLSIGVVTNRYRVFADHEDVSRVAAEMKQFSKQQPGSSYAIDTRTEQDQHVAADRRGSHLPTVLLISADAPLRGMIQTALNGANYRTLEAPGILEVNALLAHPHDLDLIVADARFGQALWDFITLFRADMPGVPMIVLVTRPEDEQIAFHNGANRVIRQPFQIQQLLAYVAQLARPGE